MSAYMGKELVLFMKSLWYGSVLLIAYDCLRILRTVFRHSGRMVAVQDLLFWIGSGLFLFSRFFRENSGILRTYLFVGTAVGMASWYFSLSAFFVGFTSGWMIKIKRKILIWVKRLKFWITRCRISLDKRRYR
ncbi:MAG: spore cortex biosynthesis protein YabQ [Clostridiales bacterium]|nr:spore cortex biosynthesis protein YabQ [Clostridiales bacterium]